MHISEAVLAATPAGQVVLLAGTAAAIVGTGIGLRQLEEDRIPQAALLGSAFFVASAIQVPMFGSSVHLVLSGLMGLILGWAAFPTVLVALVLQVAFCGIAGATVLGVNTLIMALPAVVCHYLFRTTASSNHRHTVFASGFAAGLLGILFGALLSAAALALAGRPLVILGQVFLAAHLPVAVVEGFVTGSVIVLVRQVRPEMLRAPILVTVAQEVVDG